MPRVIWKTAGLCLLALFVMSTAALAAGGQLYDVTITNLTQGQIMSPPVVVSHSWEISLFELGEPASLELAALAEDADSGGLISLLRGSDAVREVIEGDDPILPGGSTTLRIEAKGSKRLISFASMLVTTNDTFAAAQALRPSSSRSVTMVVPGYDAGSEGNNEMCAFIPGPPCENRFQRDVANAEGYVHINAGVQQIGDLTGTQDWRNPVARISIEPVRRPMGDDDDDDDD